MTSDIFVGGRVVEEVELVFWIVPPPILHKGAVGFQRRCKRVSRLVYSSRYSLRTKLKGERSIRGSERESILHDGGWLRCGRRCRTRSRVVCDRHVFRRNRSSQSDPNPDAISIKARNLDHPRSCHARLHAHAHSTQGSHRPRETAAARDRPPPPPPTPTPPPSLCAIQASPRSHTLSAPPSRPALSASPSASPRSISIRAKMHSLSGSRPRRYACRSLSSEHLLFGCRLARAPL